MGTAGTNHFLGSKVFPFVPWDRFLIHLKYAFCQFFPIKFCGPSDHGGYKFIILIACRYCVEFNGGCCMHQCCFYSGSGVVAV